MELGYAGPGTHGATGGRTAIGTGGKGNTGAGGSGRVGAAGGAPNGVGTGGVAANGGTANGSAGRAGAAGALTAGRGGRAGEAGAGGSATGGAAGDHALGGNAGVQNGGASGQAGGGLGGMGGVGAAPSVNEPPRCKPALSPSLDALSAADPGLYGPASGVVADFDRDGRLDVAIVTNYDSVAVVLGNGDGTLRPGVAYPTNLAFLGYPGSFLNATGLIATGDVNGDGWPDLVAASVLASGVAVLLGGPGGVLAPSVVCPLSGRAYGIVTADFDGDGADEIAVSYSDQYSWLLVIAGDGSCATVWGSGSINPYGALGAGDVNGDGKLDLLPSGALAVFLGDGTGKFVAGDEYDWATATSVLLEDFNRDGALDVALPANCGRWDPSSVFVRLGHGDATFGPDTEYSTGICVDPSVAADVSGDGALDLVLSTHVTLLGNGDGTFGAPVTGTEALGGELMGVGDFDGDGVPDLAAAADDDVVVRTGNGDGTFGAAPLFGTDRNPESLLLTDFDRDGKLDIATGNWGISYLDPKTVSVLFGSGNGAFAPHADYPVASATSPLVAADMNGDGRRDLVLVGVASGSVSVVLQAADGHFSSGIDSTLWPSSPGLAVGDVNGDGKQDVVAANGVLLGAGDGTLVTGPELTLPDSPSVLSLVDLNDDGVLDLVAGAEGSDVVRIYLGGSNGTFTPTYEASTGSVLAMATGDLDGDRHSDLVIVNRDSVTVLLGAGDGSFYEQTSYAPGGTSLTLSDLDGDGALDVIFSQRGISVLKGKGDGTLECLERYAVGADTGAVAAGDVNGDGRDDVVTTTPNGVSALLNAAR